MSNCQVIASYLAGIQQNGNHLVLLNSSFIADNPALVVAPNASASATNCTFANGFGNLGSAISSGGALTLLSCTVAWNSATASGGGIYSTGTVYLGNSVVADNGGFPGGVFAEEDVAGNFTSLGYNFIGTSAGSTGLTNGVNHDQTGTQCGADCFAVERGCLQWRPNHECHAGDRQPAD